MTEANQEQPPREDSAAQSQREESILTSLQRVFYNLQTEQNQAVRTIELLRAFGFSDQERMEQQDTSEFQMYLYDYIETTLKDNQLLDERFRSLFYGEKESVIKCSLINYESVTKETFSNLSVHLQESTSLQDALRSLFKAEDLTGEN